MLGFRVSLRLYCQVKAKIPLHGHGHGPDTDTDTDFFAAKRTRTDPTESRCKKVRVRVRDGPVSVSRDRVSVVEFSYKGADVQRAGVNVLQNSSTVDPISGVSRQTAVARSVLISTLRPVVQPRPPRADDTAAL